MSFTHTTVTMVNSGLIGLLAGSGLGAALSWAGLAARHRRRPARDIPHAQLRSQLAGLRVQRDTHTAQIAALSAQLAGADNHTQRHPSRAIETVLSGHRDRLPTLVGR